MTSRAEIHSECESLGEEEVARRLTAGFWVPPADQWARDWLALVDRRSSFAERINSHRLQMAATVAAIIAAICSALVLLK